MKLMISVISAAEAKDAIAGGAEILDVKNPEEGSLGAQPPKTVREIVDLGSWKVKVSVAVGDMPNLPGTAALAALGAAVCGADYIKVGMMGPHIASEGEALLNEVQQAVSGHTTSIIAAGYADFSRVNALNPDCLPDIAASAGAGGILLDTAVKDGKTLFDFLNPGQLSVLAERTHKNGLIFGLAGALGERDLKTVHAIGADIVGLRTAVCLDNRRSGPLEAARIQKLLRDGDLFSTEKES